MIVSSSVYRCWLRSMRWGRRGRGRRRSRGLLRGCRRRGRWAGTSLGSRCGWRGRGRIPRCSLSRRSAGDTAAFDGALVVSAPKTTKSRRTVPLDPAVMTLLRPTAPSRRPSASPRTPGPRRAWCSPTRPGSRSTRAPCCGCCSRPLSGWAWPGWAAHPAAQRGVVP
jgi:hypothetical protein